MGERIPPILSELQARLAANEAARRHTDEVAERKVRTDAEILTDFNLGRLDIVNAPEVFIATATLLDKPWYVYIGGWHNYNLKLEYKYLYSARYAPTREEVLERAEELLKRQTSMNVSYALSLSTEGKPLSLFCSSHGARTHSKENCYFSKSIDFIHDYADLELQTGEGVVRGGISELTIPDTLLATLDQRFNDTSKIRSFLGHIKPKRGQNQDPLTEMRARFYKQFIDLLPLTFQEQLLSKIRELENQSGSNGS